jgi:hypothetical protein
VVWEGGRGNPAPYPIGDWFYDATSHSAARIVSVRFDETESEPAQLSLLLSAGVFRNPPEGLDLRVAQRQACQIVMIRCATYCCKADRGVAPPARSCHLRNVLRRRTQPFEERTGVLYDNRTFVSDWCEETRALRREYVLWISVAVADSLYNCLTMATPDFGRAFIGLRRRTSICRDPLRRFAQ